MNMTKVSVLMITYNHQNYISDAINGILTQKTDFEFELIIANDCSTDKTNDVIKDFMNKHPKGNLIKYICHEKNIGMRLNYISAAKICKGKYVAPCEGDDYWTDPHKLEKQVKFLDMSEEYSMCFTNSSIVDEDNNIKKTNRVDENNRKDITQAEILNGFVPPTNTVLYRNSFLQKIISDFPNIINGDYYISILMANYGIIGYIDNNTAAYRLHEGSSWSKLEEDKRRIEYTRTLMSLKGRIKQPNEKILFDMINSNLSNLRELMEKEEYTENGNWTPQTAMLRSIRDTVLNIDGAPINALSVDNNPEIEKMLLRKWPMLDITKTQWPEYDAQNLHQFKDETFDIVFSHQVLEHIPKPWLAASEMNRVLKKGGIGIHSSCAYNPRHGYPAFKDYYRFLPDGLAELFEGVNIWVKEGWGSKEAIIYNLTIDDGHGQLGGRRFVEALGQKNDENYPWHTWVIFQKI